MNTHKGKHSKVVVGQRFGRLIVERLLSKRGGKLLCRCDCGVEKHLSRVRLVSGNTASCGCYQREVARRVKTRHGYARKGIESAAWKAWARMNRRCLNTGDSNYRNYGGRGISICDRWLGKDGFVNFIRDMGEPPPGCTLDRRHNDLGYTPANCRWATLKTQCNNKRNNRFLTYLGEKLTISQWAERFQIRHGTIWMRLQRGWSVELALTTPAAPLRDGSIYTDYHDEVGNR